jgi:hypothetical protein
MTDYEYGQLKKRLEDLKAFNLPKDRESILDLEARISEYETKVVEWQAHQHLKKGRKEEVFFDEVEEECRRQAKDIILRTFASDKIRNNPARAGSFLPSVVIDYRSDTYYYVRVECNSDGYLCPHCEKWRVGHPFYLRGKMSHDTRRDEQDPRIKLATNIRFQWEFTCSTEAFTKFLGNLKKREQDKEEAKRMEEEGEVLPKGYRYLKTRPENAEGVIKHKKNAKKKQNKYEQYWRKEVMSTWVPLDEDVLGCWTLNERTYRRIRADGMEDIDDDYVIERARSFPPSKKCQVLKSWSSELSLDDLKEMLIAKILQDNTSSTIEMDSDELIAEGITELFGQGLYSHIFYDLCYSSLTGEPYNFPGGLPPRESEHHKNTIITSAEDVEKNQCVEGARPCDGDLRWEEFAKDVIARLRLYTHSSGVEDWTYVSDVVAVIRGECPLELPPPNKRRNPLTSFIKKTIEAIPGMKVVRKRINGKPQQPAIRGFFADQRSSASSKCVEEE